MTDPGLARERTALAWQRTALTLAAGTLIIARVNVERSPLVAYVETGIGLPLCLWAAVLLGHRGRQRGTLDGRPFALLALVIIVLATAEFVIAVTH